MAGDIAASSLDGGSRFNLSLAQVLAIAKKRMWLLIISVAGALVLGLAVTLLMTPQYTSKTVIEIQRETRNFTNVDGANSRTTDTIDPEFYETQIGLLKSVELANNVATDNRLQDDANFFKMFGSRKAGKWFENGRLILAHRRGMNA